MEWFWLALTCAFSLATADALTKKYLGDYTAPELALVRFVGTGLLLSPLLLWQPPPPLPAVAWGWIALAVPLEILAMLLYMRAIRDSPLALTLPYLAFTPALTTLTGYLILGEQVSGRKLGGILLVVAGAWLLNLEAGPARSWRTWLAPLRAIGREPGSRLMLLVAAIYSLTSVVGKKLLAFIPVMVFGPLYYVLVGSLVLALFSFRQPRIGRVLWRRPGPQLLIATLLSGMVITHFLAISQVEAAYMIAVKRTSLLFGIAYGALWFGEKKLFQHVLAGALMLLGVMLLAL